MFDGPPASMGVGFMLPFMPFSVGLVLFAVAFPIWGTQPRWALVLVMPGPIVDFAPLPLPLA